MFIYVYIIQYNVLQEEKKFKKSKSGSSAQFSPSARCGLLNKAQFKLQLLKFMMLGRSGCRRSLAQEKAASFVAF